MAAYAGDGRRPTTHPARRSASVRRAGAGPVSRLDGPGSAQRGSITLPGVAPSRSPADGTCAFASPIDRGLRKELRHTMFTRTRLGESSEREEAPDPHRPIIHDAGMGSSSARWVHVARTGTPSSLPTCALVEGALVFQDDPWQGQSPSSPRRTGARGTSAAAQTRSPRRVRTRSARDTSGCA